MNGTAKVTSSKKATSSKKVTSSKKAKQDKEKDAEEKKRSSSSGKVNGDEAETKDESKEKTKAAPTSRGVLKLGQTLPHITLQDNTEAEVDVATLTEGGKGVVLFLYPRVSCSLRVGTHYWQYLNAGIRQMTSDDQAKEWS